MVLNAVLGHQARREMRDAAARVIANALLRHVAMVKTIDF
jgi:hypothetical protein